MKGPMICPYCGKSAELVYGDRVYPHRKDLVRRVSGLRFWLCIPCDAYVGCHKPNPKYGLNGSEPLGTMANEELRSLRAKLHKVFDPLWISGEMDRAGAYRWMAQMLGISVESCHIGMFDEGKCRKVFEVLEAR